MEKFKLLQDPRKNAYDFFEQSISTSKSKGILACNVYGKTKKEVIIRAQLIESSPEMFDELVKIMKTYDKSTDTYIRVMKLLTKITQ